MEKASVDLLKEISKKENWDFSVQERIINARYGRTERTVQIINSNFKEAYFLSVQKIELSKYNLFSGIFFPILNEREFAFNIRKRDVLDKMNFRKNKTRFKIGNSEFDTKIYVETNNDIKMHKLFSSSGIQYDVINFLNQEKVINIGFNQVNPLINQQKREHKYLSVYLLDEWMLDKSLIKSSFQIAKKIYDKLINIR